MASKHTAVGAGGEEGTNDMPPPSLSKWFNEIPGALMAPAAMVTLVTFRAAMNPPARLTMFPASYACFKVLNSLTLFSSVVVLIMSQRFCGKPPARMATAVALFGMLCLTSAFVFASSPQDPVAGLAPFLPAVVLCVLVYTVCVLVFGKRATR